MIADRPGRRLLLVLALCLAPSALLAQGDSERELEAAMAAMRRRDHAGAAELYTRALADPSLSLEQTLRALRGRGHAFHELRQFKFALADYSRAIDLRPGFADLWNSRCWSRLYIGQPRAALEDCEVALKLDPRFGAALDSRAMAWSALGEWDKALEDHKRAIERSKVAEHYYNRAITYERRGDREAADKDFATARKMASDEEHWLRIEREMAPLRAASAAAMPTPPAPQPRPLPKSGEGGAQPDTRPR